MRRANKSEIGRITSWPPHLYVSEPIGGRGDTDYNSGHSVTAARWPATWSTWIQLTICLTIWLSDSYQNMTSSHLTSECLTIWLSYSYELKYDILPSVWPSDYLPAYRWHSTIWHSAIWLSDHLTIWNSAIGPCDHLTIWQFARLQMTYEHITNDSQIFCNIWQKI